MDISIEIGVGFTSSTSRCSVHSLAVGISGTRTIDPGLALTIVPPANGVEGTTPVDVVGSALVADVQTADVEGADAFDTIGSVFVLYAVAHGTAEVFVSTADAAAEDADISVKSCVGTAIPILQVKSHQNLALLSRAFQCVCQ